MNPSQAHSSDGGFGLATSENESDIPQHYRTVGGVRVSQAAAGLRACVGGNISSSQLCRLQIQSCGICFCFIKLHAERWQGRWQIEEGGEAGVKFEPTTSQVHGIHRSPRIRWDALTAESFCTVMQWSNPRILMSLKSLPTAADWWRFSVWAHRIRVYQRELVICNVSKGQTVDKLNCKVALKWLVLKNLNVCTHVRKLSFTNLAVISNEYVGAII